MYIYIHTYLHTYIHTCIHTYIHMCIYVFSTSLPCLGVPEYMSLVVHVGLRVCRVSGLCETATPAWSIGP